MWRASIIAVALSVAAITGMVPEVGAGELELRGAGASPSLRAPSMGASVAGLGEFTLDGHQAVAVGAPGGGQDRGAVTIVLDVSGGRSGPPRGTGIRFVGEQRGERFGAALAGGGDVNGDGFPDLVVGAPDASPYGRRDAGAVWVIFGVPAPGAIELTKLRPEQGYEIVGAAPGDHLGAAVAIDRDFSGDGHEDIVIGAPGAQGGRGAMYGIDSVLRSETLDLRHLPATRGFAVTGAPAGARFGASVAAGGYQNGDPYAELVGGAPGAYGGRGAAYVVWGRPSGGPGVRLGTPGTGYEVQGLDPEDHAGAAVATIGEINHDGASDIAIGAPNAWIRGRNRAGEVLVVLGGDYSGLIPASYAIEGVHAGDRTGSSLGGGLGTPGVRAGLVIGAPGASFSAQRAGAAYVLSGSGLGRNVDLYRLSGPSFRMDGARAGDEAGASVAEFNGGSLDALIGSPGGGSRGAGAFVARR
jgi:FG-GAP repeat